MKSRLLTALIVISFALLFLQKPVCAFADGNMLLESCDVALKSMNSQSQEFTGDPFGAGYCLGLVYGVRELNRVYQIGVKIDNPLFCLPDEGISNDQTIRVVTKYLHDHPTSLHKQEIFLAISAFRDAFPCGK